MKAIFFSLLVLLVFVAACNRQPTSKLSNNAEATMFKNGDLLLTDANFEQEVIQSTEPVLVDFSADWCPPCRQMAPSIDELAIEYRGRVKVGKVNVDENVGMTKKYGIDGFPTLLVFKNGEVIDRAIGFQEKDKLAMMLNDALQSK